MAGRGLILPLSVMAVSVSESFLSPGGGEREGGRRERQSETESFRYRWLGGNPSQSCRCLEDVESDVEQLRNV